jgi:hypothetical protein
VKIKSYERNKNLHTKQNRVTSLEKLSLADFINERSRNPLRPCGFTEDLGMFLAAPSLTDHTVYQNYGNTGCGVFKGGIQN